MYSISVGGKIIEVTLSTRSGTPQLLKKPLAIRPNVSHT